MEEKKVDQPTSDSKSTSEANNSANSDSFNEVLSELNKLGNKFLEVVQTLWASDQRKKLEGDMRSGLASLTANLEQGLKQVSESQETKEILNKAGEVAETFTEKMRTSKVANEVADGLSKGLRSLTEQVDKLASEFQSNEQASKNEDATKAQDIPVTKV
jgi:uncharacterized phage infection (PIP) family protein YhgE